MVTVGQGEFDRGEITLGRGDLTATEGVDRDDGEHDQCQCCSDDPSPLVARDHHGHLFLHHSNRHHSNRF